jgi:hypothetical protein
MSYPDGEKRDAERIPILGELRGEVMIFQPVVIKEISIGGADIESGFALQPNTLHDFRLSLGERSVVVKAASCAVRSAMWTRRSCSTDLVWSLSSLPTGSATQSPSSLTD